MNTFKFYYIIILDICLNNIIYNFILNLFVIASGGPNLTNSKGNLAVLGNNNVIGIAVDADNGIIIIRFMLSIYLFVFLLKIK